MCVTFFQVRVRHASTLGDSDYFSQEAKKKKENIYSIPLQTYKVGFLFCLQKKTSLKTKCVFFQEMRFPIDLSPPIYILGGRTEPLDLRVYMMRFPVR